MNPYAVLGIDKEASDRTVNSAYRKLSKAYHPDAGGDREEFERIKLAYDVLRDPARRKRYDTTGRIDESAVTEDRVRAMIRNAVIGIVNGPKSGEMDDPVWVDVRKKVLLSVFEARKQIQNNMAETQRKLERVVRLLERFRPKTDQDPVGDTLREQKKLLEEETVEHENAMEMSSEVEKIFRSYDYEVGPGPEGQFSPGPPPRRGTMFLGGSSNRPSPR